MAFLAAIPAAISSFVGSAGSVLGTVGTIASAGTSILGGIAANNAAKAQEQIARNNSAIAEENAQRASEAAQNQQIQSDNEIAAFVGQQKAQQSASGLSTNSRSSMLTRRAAQRIGRQDALNIINQGRAETRNFQQQAADFRTEGNMARSAGRNALISGFLNAGSSLVGSASPTRSKFGSTLSRPDPWKGLRRAV